MSYLFLDLVVAKSLQSTRMVTDDADDDDDVDEPEQGVRQTHQGDLRLHQGGGLLQSYQNDDDQLILSKSNTE